MSHTAYGLRWGGHADAKGEIHIPIKATGPHRLHAIVMERCAAPKVAAWESFWASITFAIAEDGKRKTVELIPGSMLRPDCEAEWRPPVGTTACDGVPRKRSRRRQSR